MGSRAWASVVVARGLSCPAACGIFLDQGSNQCPLHWQADFQPWGHQGSPCANISLKWVSVKSNTLFLSPLQSGHLFPENGMVFTLATRSVETLSVSVMRACVTSSPALCGCVFVLWLRVQTSESGWLASNPVWLWEGYSMSLGLSFLIWKKIIIITWYVSSKAIRI